MVLRAVIFGMFMACPIVVHQGQVRVKYTETELKAANIQKVLVLIGKLRRLALLNAKEANGLTWGGATRIDGQNSTGGV